MNTPLVFMGSPEFAIPILQGLAEHYPVVGVVTQPDRPAGRGRTLTPPPVKALAEALGLPVIQPRRMRDPEARQQLQAWAPEMIVVAAFGQILRSDVLDMPRFGCINVHASLLPRWRGAAPIQAAILHGDAETGATIMQMDPGIDTGPIFTQRRLPILPADTAETLGERLARTGAELLLETLPGIISGQIRPQPQDESQATYISMLKKEDGLLDFSQPAEALERRVRAFTPWPSAYMLWQGQALKIHRAHVASSAKAGLPPGTTTLSAGLPAVVTTQGWLVLDEVQPAGKKSMSGSVFLNGARSWAQS